MKKKILLALTAPILFFSCGKNSSEYKELKSSYDSLALVKQGYESDLLRTDSLMAIILDNFQSINEEENLITIGSKSGDLERNNAKSISDKINLIGSKLQSSKDAIDKLNEKIKSSNDVNSRLYRTVAALKKQLEDKEKQVSNLVYTLQQRNKDILDLDNELNSRISDIDNLREAQAQKDSKLREMDRSLNSVQFCIGTRKDLEDLHVMVDGRLTIEKADDGYFTKIDKRDLTNIPLGKTSRARILTLHPEGSFKLNNNNDGTMTLMILDKNQFWQNSKILVVEVK